MNRRSGKIQALFWAAFFAIIFVTWIAGVELYALIFSAPLSDASIKLLFALHFLVGFFALAGLVVATLINNSFYRSLFSGVIFLLFCSLIAIRTFSD